MKRLIEKKIIDWANDKEDLKPLFILGARQVGKTYSILKIANQLFKDNYIYINFLTDEDYYEKLNGITSHNKIIDIIEYVSGKHINDQTLIIFDEVQRVPSIKTSLKNFVEAGSKVKIICSGSYLGNFLKNDNYSFPVGKIHRLHMYPMSFEEFVIARGQEKIYTTAKQDLLNHKEVNKADHFILTDLVYDYMIVGGMPEVVDMYINKANYLSINKRKQEILEDYKNDISKYDMKPNDKFKAESIFKNIPIFLSKLNKKYMLSKISGTARYINYANAIQNLLITQIIYKINNISSLATPIKTKRIENEFKVYYNDCGFVSTIFNLNKDILLDSKSNIYSNERGALAENFVLTEINKKMLDFNLSYYSFLGNDNLENDVTAKSGTHKNYEIDFVLDDDKGLSIPIEVKFGKTYSTSSLSKVINDNHPPYSIIFSAKNYSYDLDKQIYRFPLYFVSMIDIENDRLLCNQIKITS